MKRILGNSKLKKILISMILVIMVFQILMPSFVYAEVIKLGESNGGEHTNARLSNWMVHDKIKNNNEYKTLIKTAVKEGLCSNSMCVDLSLWVEDPKLTEAQREKLISGMVEETGIHSYIRIVDGEFDTDTKQFKFYQVNWVDVQNNEYPGKSWQYNTEKWLVEQYIIKSYDSMFNWVKSTGKTQEQLDAELIPFIEESELLADQELDSRIIDEYGSKENFLKQVLEDNRSSVKIYVIGTASDYEIISVDFPGVDRNQLLEPYAPEENGEADLGGLLLSPVFYLVNFIADAVISNLGRIMTGEGSRHGFDVLVANPVTNNYTQTSEIKEYMSNALGFVQYPNIKYTPEEIFSGKIDLLSIDFISGKNSAGEEITGEWQDIRKVISAWYKVLRMIAIIGLLSVLIYTGIKIIISSNAKDKAKYKEWIVNWFIAVAILFSMHYIMSFIISVIGEINSLLGNACQGILVKHQGGFPFNDFTTNLMGLVRFMIQSEDFATKVGYEVMYIALIVYTIKFTVVYLKRVLNMAFLTLIAPIVALTYPIDKMNDGSAQGFNMWLKEYIFNALLQPMHYLMYYILVGSAVGIAASNPIYGIVVLMFMTEAEKLLKKIFGFDKAGGGTVGGMANAFAAGAVASQIGKMAKGLIKGPGKGGNGGNGGNGNVELPPTMKDANNVEENFNGLPESNENDNIHQDNRQHDQDDNNNQDINNRVAEILEEEQQRMTVQDYREAGMSPQEWREQRQLQIEEQLRQEHSQEAANPTQQIENSNPDSNSNPNANPEPDSGEPMDKKAERLNRMKAGAKALGKKAIKPIWDVEKSKKYNGKRLVRRVGKTAAGFALGTAAAAVQAGISITDGKYSPMEGIASFGAGWAGGKRLENGIVNTAKGVKSTFDQGYHSADDPDQKEKWEKKQRQRYFEDWSNRDDVNKVFKDKFGEDQFKEMKKQADEYTNRGYTDPKEVAKLMKANNKLGWEHKKTIAAMNFKKQLQDQQSYGAVSDLDKRNKYIQSIIDNRGLSGDEANKVRRQYEEAFKAVASLNDAMK